MRLWAPSSRAKGPGTSLGPACDRPGTGLEALAEVRVGGSARHHGLVTATVRDAESQEDLDEVRRLFREFVVWHRARQAHNAGLIAAYFDGDAWQAELDGLPGAYAAAEGGALLVAGLDGDLVGCVALRQVDDESGEMKRMYVGDPGRGQGVGRLLGEAVVQRARDLGYSAVLLDTSVEQHEAIALYRSLGFVEVEPYYAVSDAMRDWLVFFRLGL
jgi:GNAT superfamily N-acetyltransferase